MEGAWIYKSGNLIDKLNLSTYIFYDSGDGLVTAEGSWVSTTRFAFPLSTAVIECWKDFGHCWVADATVFDFGDSTPILAAGLNLKEIAEWTDDYILTKPYVPLTGCVEETYRLDRKSEVVTYTRKTIKTIDTCEGTSTEPIVSKLGDGYERLRIYKQLAK